MKKCPFCAEEIQDEAIKCRYCGTMLPTAAAVSSTSGAASSAPVPTPRAADSKPPFARGGVGEAAPRKVLYDGFPSWRGYLGYYAVGGLAVLVGPLLTNALARWLATSTTTRVLLIIVPMLMGAVFFYGMHLWRRAKRIRVTTSNIEFESGVFSKKIEVTELWRCRDVRYRQSFVDRVIGVAHIDIITSDPTTPQIELAGLPASRELYEQIRDSIELQRQSRNVYGVIS